MLPILSYLQRLHSNVLWVGLNIFWGAFKQNGRIVRTQTAFKCTNICVNANAAFCWLEFYQTRPTRALNHTASSCLEMNHASSRKFCFHLYCSWRFGVADAGVRLWCRETCQCEQQHGRWVDALKDADGGEKTDNTGGGGLKPRVGAAGDELVVAEYCNSENKS